jgi:hypothetical protein
MEMKRPDRACRAVLAQDLHNGGDHKRCQLGRCLGQAEQVEKLIAPRGSAPRRVCGKACQPTDDRRRQGWFGPCGRNFQGCRRRLRRLVLRVVKQDGRHMLAVVAHRAGAIANATQLPAPVLLQTDGLLVGLWSGAACGALQHAAILGQFRPQDAALAQIVEARIDREDGQRIGQSECVEPDGGRWGSGGCHGRSLWELCAVIHIRGDRPVSSTMLRSCLPTHGNFPHLAWQAANGSFAPSSAAEALEGAAGPSA